MTRPRSDAPPALAARSQGWGRTVFEIPQARRRTRRRSLREVLSHHLSARWQIYALLVFLLLFSWMNLTGVVRAEFLRGRNLEYVRAAKALGVSDLAVMWRHILPNAMVATLTFLPFTLSGSVAVLSTLDFLGFGLPPGSPSLGELVAQGKNNLAAPWLGMTAFLVLGGVLTLLIFIGEAVRDAFDPRKEPR